MAYMDDGFIGDKSWQAHRVNDVPPMPDDPLDEEPLRVVVDRRTHYIRFEDESEDSVTIVVEKKDAG